MAASWNRTDWGLLVLRLGAGTMAILHGLTPLQHVGSWSLSQVPSGGLQLLWGLLEVVCGALLIGGIWMWPAALGIIVLIGIPLFRPVSIHSLITVHVQTVFRMVVTFASALAGAGRASFSK